MTQWVTNLRLDLFPRPSVMAFVPFFSLVLWILALRSDIPFPFLPHLFPPKPAHTSHLYPAIPLSRHAHTYYTVHTTHASIFSAFTLFSHPTVSHSLIPRAISICSPFFIPRSFRSFCPNYIPFASLALSVLSLFPLRSCFCQRLDLCSLFNLSSSFTLLLLCGMAIIRNIGTAPVQSLECSAFVPPMESCGGAKTRITQPYCFSVLGKNRSHCPTLPHCSHEVGSKGLPSKVVWRFYSTQATRSSLLCRQLTTIIMSMTSCGILFTISCFAPS
jgi:hypothetical protein